MLPANALSAHGSRLNVDGNKAPDMQIGDIFLLYEATPGLFANVHQVLCCSNCGDIVLLEQV